MQRFKRNNNCDRYCDHQLRDVKAVETGLRPLRVRERGALVARKSAAKTREDEWDKDGRPPTHTKEHRLHDKGGRSAVDAVASTLQQNGRKNSTETDVIELRNHIRDHGLTAGTVVQTFNDTNSDEWLRSYMLVLFVTCSLYLQVHENRRRNRV